MKAKLRQLFIQKRDQIDLKRQKACELAFMRRTLPSSHRYILSYSSIHSELKTTRLNEQLAKEARLVLPRVEGSRLALFLVTDINKELCLGKHQILEPNPNLCKKIPLSEVPFALIPGLAFDKNFSRLGYGKGYYDKLLEETPHLHSVGVGFTEQFSIEPLPQEAHDQNLKDVYVF